jgi:hypothetical protein
LKVPNNIWQDWINRLTYQLIVFFSNVKETTMLPDIEMNPIWVTGLFRSGTTITTQLLQQLGVDLGPEEDLLKGIGKRQSMNPQGFHENYLCMELSIHVFNQLNAWGDNPPQKEVVEQFDMNTIKYKHFVYDSVVNMHDDRISNRNKMRIYKDYYPGNIDKYFRKHFSSLFAIKNPHFSLLTPLLDQYWPNAKYLVVFRNPIATIASAQKVTPKASYELYNTYYSRIIDHPNAVFFSYDKLVADPQYSVEQLKKVFHLNGNTEEAITLIKAKTSTSKGVEPPTKTINLYNQMLQKAINNSVS